jgi:acyl phosphate:glycerol-3-phosphate acyltransferase
MRPLTRPGQALAGAIGYGLGSLLVSPWVARRHGIDLHRSGSGNPGAWNALQQLGGRRAAPAFVGDGAKGLAAGLIGRRIGGWEGAWAGVAGAMLGHAFPLAHPMRGGKSVMCFAGGAIALSPRAAAISAAGGAALLPLGGFPVGARAAVFAFPVAQLFTDPVERVAATGVLMTGIGSLFLLRPDRRAPARPGWGAAPSA